MTWSLPLLPPTRPRRLRAGVRSVRSPHDPQSNRIQAIRLLSAARTRLQTSWLQGGWWAEQRADGRTAVFGGWALPTGRGDTARRNVTGVCLVGAVIEAEPDGVRPDRIVHDTAVSALYDALWSTPAGGPGTGDRPGDQSLSPVERTSIVRRVAAWNDRPGRTTDDVIELIDRAILRLSDDPSALEVTGR
jgi:hypothetical protein